MANDFVINEISDILNLTGTVKTTVTLSEDTIDMLFKRVNNELSAYREYIDQVILEVIPLDKGFDYALNFYTGSPEPKLIVSFSRNPEYHNEFPLTENELQIIDGAFSSVYTEMDSLHELLTSLDDSENRFSVTKSFDNLLHTMKFSINKDDKGYYLKDLTGQDRCNEWLIETPSDVIEVLCSVNHTGGTYLNEYYFNDLENDAEKTFNMDFSDTEQNNPYTVSEWKEFMDKNPAFKEKHLKEYETIWLLDKDETTINRQIKLDNYLSPRNKAIEKE